MPTLETTVDGLKFKNPFVIASGPPGTNMNVINKAFKEGWGAVIAKTVSLDAGKVVNVTPRYAKLYAGDRDAGVVTSAGESPRSGTIALGYAHRDFIVAGTELEVETPSGRAPAIVTDVPVPSAV